MSASTPRIVRNGAAARNLNSTHGLVFHDSVPLIARSLLPLLALSSVSLMSAEMVGRSYGGGVLKMEPREADSWLIPSPAIAVHIADHHANAIRIATRHIEANDLTAATTVIDALLEASAAELGFANLATHEATEIRIERLGRRLTRAATRHDRSV